MSDDVERAYQELMELIEETDRTIVTHLYTECVAAINRADIAIVMKEALDDAQSP